MNEFVKQFPALAVGFMGMLITYFLYSSNQTLSRINATLDKHMEMILALTKELEYLKGEHKARGDTCKNE